MSATVPDGLPRARRDHRCARVVVGVEQGRSRALVLEPGTFASPRPMAARGPAARIALVAVRASLCAGDRFELYVELGPRAQAELVDPGGTVAYGMRGGRAVWRATVVLGEGARLRWSEQPFVLSEGADVGREVRMDLSEGAEALWRETLILGREGERGGALRSTTRITHAGRELLVEDLDLREAGIRELPGILGPNRILGQVGLFGRRPPGGGPAPGRLDLAGPGALHRLLTDRSFRADRVLDPVWREWSLPAPAR